MGEITYPIAEVFRSIQGEGYHAGRPAVFVRFAGCNLACPFCDTDHSATEDLPIMALVTRIINLEKACDIIVLTGGEPTLYEIIPLIKALAPRKICIETNGVLWQRLRGVRQACPADVWITVSPKPQRVSYKALEYADEVKVVFDTFREAVLGKIYDRTPLRIVQGRRTYIQPCSGDIKPALDYVMAHPWWRLSVQLHKLIGVR